MHNDEATFCRYESPINAELCEESLQLSEVVFGECDRLDCSWRIKHMPQLTLFGARRGSQLVGFKMGYAVTSRRYYSWLGGIHPEYRGFGLARQLMSLQHDWIRHNGFSVVETKVKEGNVAMRDLNAAAGFVQVGSELKGETKKLVLRKNVIDTVQQA